MRGVRYFRCRNKHGIFVHSHKVKCADETTLSRLNLLEGFCSPESTEKRDKVALDSELGMASSDVEIVNGNHTVYKHRDVKSLRLTRRNRSVSLDRYLFLKTKQLAKGLNVLIYNAEKSDKVDTCEQNRINRSVSLPKISKENASDSNEFCLASEMAPLEKNLWNEKNKVINTKEECIDNGEQKDDPENTNTTGVVCPAEEGINGTCRSEDIKLTCPGNLPLEDSLHKSKDYDTNMGQNVSKGGTVAHKVGHAFSLDTHLMIEKGQLTVTSNGPKEEFSYQSHHANKEDPFIEGRYCSCPSLHCADHFSEAITTCLDLGHTERPVIHEATGENDTSLDTANAAGVPNNHVHSHSQSEVLEKLFQTVKILRSESSSSRDSEFVRKSSWPWLTSTPKQSLRSYGSCDDVNTPGAAGNEDAFDEGFSSILAQVKLISNNTAEKHYHLESISRAGDNLSVNKGMGPMPIASEDQAVDAGSNYAGSLSGSQASLSSTGTCDSKGKKMSTKKRMHNSTKGSGLKPKSIPSSGLSAPKAIQKQSRLEQMRQQQQNRKSLLLSSANKSQVADKTGSNTESNSVSKIKKRHTLAGISDMKSFVPRPAVSKRPLSDGITGIPGKSDMKEASTKLPVKKMSTPSQISRPTALPKIERNTNTGSAVQRRDSAAASRQPAVPVVKRNSSVTQSDSKIRKPSKVVQKSTGKEKELSVVGQTVGGQASLSAKGLKGVTTTGSKPQTSRVARSSSSAKGI